MPNFTFVTKPSTVSNDLEKLIRDASSALVTNKHFVIAIGGDGTMLQAVKEYLHQDVIFIGVSAGSLGLLQTINQHQVHALIESIKNKTFEVLKSPLLQVNYCQPTNSNAKDDVEEDIIGFGFNDISVERQDSKAVKFKLSVNGSSGNFIGDGVIFATALGSTAYSLAAGGPIIDSEIDDVYVITPNNPHISNLHSSLYRPHVLASNRSVRIELAPEDKVDRPLQISIDGKVAAKDVVSPINITLSKKYVSILQLEKNSLHKQIEEKRLGRL